MRKKSDYDDVVQMTWKIHINNILNFAFKNTGIILNTYENYNLLLRSDRTTVKSLLQKTND